MACRKGFDETSGKVATTCGVPAAYAGVTPTAWQTGSRWHDLSDCPDLSSKITKLKRVAWSANRNDRYDVRQEEPNYWWKDGDPKYNTWDGIIESGRDYLFGSDCSMEKFLKRSSSNMPEWMQIAVAICNEHPEAQFNVRNGRQEYRIYKRGEYVQVSLPYHDAGGEYDWVTRDGKRRVQVNQD